ncbi:hypothetical protein WA026_023685 [Henosepilachna vigintioctopunctata]|uniref:Retrovirus-related Pol polyprotein from transposon TNT 1-94 n=1 Tax=Henosepilachna vigintioctopunctata TaxID=420089 RepID=A0AAW1TTN6_9CUCU
MAVNFLSSVPRLKGRENYTEWAFAVRNVLVLDDLHGCIDGVETDAVKDGKAKAKLVLTIDSSLFVHIKEAATTKELWLNLKKLFDDSGFTRKIGLLRLLVSIKLENSDSMETYVTQLIETAQKLKGTGFEIDDKWIGSLLLAGLPEKYLPMIMAIEHSGMDLSVDAIKRKLLDSEPEPVGNTGSAFSIRKVGNTVDRQKKDSSKTSSVRNVKQVKCFKCQQTGHFKNKCPLNKDRNMNAFSAAFLCGNFDKTDWYIDSGASKHLTVRRDWIKNISDCGKQEIVTANNQKLSAKSSVTDVLFIPELKTNLISVSQLIRNGNSVKFDAGGCCIFNKKNNLIGTARLVNNVYKLNIKNKEHCFLSTASSRIWHRRFGHINNQDLCNMEAAVNGMKITSRENLTNRCVICCEGKQSRDAFKNKGTRANSVLEIVHTDICGPMETISLGGSRYFLLFEDDFSKMTFVYFLKNKSEVFECFKRFRMMVENQMDTGIKILRSDNGGEFCGKDMRNYLAMNGIIHQTTNPYTPQQNGVVERMNRSLVEKAKCMLFDAKLDTKFWAEAVNTAAYLKNRSPSQTLKNKTPYEMWFNHKPNVSNVRVFGSKIMVHVPKERRTKWQKNSVEMILMGYGERTKGYRVYNPDNNVISTSRDVVVIENDEIEISLDNTDSVGATEQDKELEVKTSDDDEQYGANDDTNGDSDYIPDCPIPDSRTDQEPRRSKREAKPKKFVDHISYMCALNSNQEDLKYSEDPVTVDEALSKWDREQWKAAMEEEYNSFVRNNAWEIAELPKGASVVDSKWVFKKKINSDGSVRYRARLVARGFSQKSGIDFNETFSPVVRHSSLRLLIAMSVQLNLKIIHLDVMTAFLNGELNETIFMKQPEGFQVSKDINKFCKLNKAIYGLKQASRAWNMKVNKVLTDIGYERSKIEHCIYVKSKDNLLTIIALYVDDFFVFTNDVSEEIFLIENLSNNFMIKNLGEAKKCLGMNITRNYEKGTIVIDQKDYILQLLEKFNMSECKSVKTPLESKLEFDLTKENCKDVPYQELIGSLMYLAVLTRPDIAYSVSFLSQFNNNHSVEQWKCAKRILRYLKSTKDNCLVFTKSTDNLHGFVDADWGSDKLDRKSYTGFVFKISNSAISWESKKQRTVALSSTEAEYMAMAEATKEAIYLQNLIFEITGKLNYITLFNDNKSAQALANNPVYHKRSKHIDIRYHFIRDAVLNNQIKLEYLQIDKMTADIFTKSLSVDKHYRCLNELNMNVMI